MKKNFFILFLASFVMASCNNTQTTDNQTMTNDNNSKLKHQEWTKHSNIYEVNVRQYTEEGTFNAFDKHLERLADMGVDILWFMPISPIGEKNRKGSLGSYYSIKDYTAINPEFGTMEDFKNMVNHAHKLGMHVIIDWVANHTAWDHYWVQEHPEYYKHDSEGKIESPFDWTDVLALDYENHDLWKAMANEMKFWLENADIDGFRCDVAMLVKTEFWDSARVELDKVKPVFMLAEAELPEHHLHAFDMSYAWEMHHVFADVAKGKKPASALNERIVEDSKLFSSNDYRMQFTTNHDENTWNGTEYEKMGDGAKTMAVLTFTIPGMPLIYSGQEAANKKRLRFFDKDTLSWDSIPLADFYKNLIDLKNENKALWNGDFGGSYNELTTTNAEHVFAFVREKDDNKVLFVGNMSAEPCTIQINFDKFAGKYQDWFTKGEVEFADTNDFVLGPWQYNIFVK
jgi:glycosidase